MWEEQRSQRECRAGRMQAAFNHGLLGLTAIRRSAAPAARPTAPPRAHLPPFRVSSDSARDGRLPRATHSTNVPRGKVFPGREPAQRLRSTFSVRSGVAARGESVASDRDGRGASQARRDDRECREHLRSNAAREDASRVECTQSFTTGCWTHIRHQTPAS
jgi:hypothetical protein